MKDCYMNSTYARRSGAQIQLRIIIDETKDTVIAVIAFAPDGYVVVLK